MYRHHFFPNFDPIKFNLLQAGVAYLPTPKGFLMFSGGIDKQHWAVMS